MAWNWAIAKSRGVLHIREGSPCQDAAACTLKAPNSIIIAAVSDGAGSAPMGRQGAHITCRTISERARLHFGHSAIMPDDDVIWSWLDEIRDRIGLAAAQREIEPRQFAATLVASFASDTELLTLHIGDGATVGKFDDGWKAVSWPATGEYASTTFFVTDDPAPQLRITRTAESPTALAIFSDGLERLALDFALNKPHEPFFDGIFKPVLGSEEPGKDFRLSASLARYLNSDVVNNRTDDDKSLILAVRR